MHACRFKREHKKRMNQHTESRRSSALSLRTVRFSPLSIVWKMHRGCSNSEDKYKEKTTGIYMSAIYLPNQIDMMHAAT